MLCWVQCTKLTPEYKVRLADICMTALITILLQLLIHASMCVVKVMWTCTGLQRMIMEYLVRLGKPLELARICTSLPVSKAQGQHWTSITLPLNKLSSNMAATNLH